MDYDTIRVELRERVATLTIDRPSKLNALNPTVLTELTRAVYELGRSEARAAVLTGAGDKAFVAGADIEAMSGMTTTEAKAFSDAGHRLAAHLEASPVPFVAAVNGFALGGGCELALACDFIYASDRARFGQPEVKLGLMPGFGGTQRLARRVGLGLARELIYTGEPIDAEQALAIGLVNRVVPHADLAAEARKVAVTIAERAPLAVSASKRAMARGVDADLATGCELEAAAFSALFGTRDMREGTRAFLEKRAIEFAGE